jgi:hypothetical protein
MGKALSRNQASYAAPDAIAIAMESLNTLAARLVDAGLKESAIAHFKYLQHIPRKRGTVSPVYPARNETLFH